MKDVLCKVCSKPVGIKRHDNHILHTKYILTCTDCRRKENVANLVDDLVFTRVEVIDEKGRAYVSWSRHKVSVQDNGRTIKLFKLPEDVV